MSTLESEEEKIVLTEDYAGQKRKRKVYALCALSENFEIDLSKGIENFLKQNFPEFSISKPKNSKELEKVFGKDIAVLLVDDQFESDLDVLMKMVLALKIKKKEETIPVLFLTSNPKDLVDSYMKYLSAYQENDHYLEYKKNNLNFLNSKIKTLIKNKQMRRSRRVKTKIEVHYSLLGFEKFYQGFLVDISIHGGFLENTGHVLRIGDQITVRLPVSKYLGTESGDFLRLSAKVRRTSLTGDKSALMWQHMTENKIRFCIKLVSEILTRDMKINHR